MGCGVLSRQLRVFPGWGGAVRGVWLAGDVDSGVDLQFSGMLRFPGGSVAQFDSVFRGPLRGEMEVVGADATLRIIVRSGPTR